MTEEEALANLEQSIKDYYDVVFEEAGHSQAILTHWIVIAARAGWNKGGEDVTQISIVPHGPGYAMVGLCDEAMLRFRVESEQELKGSFDE